MTLKNKYLPFITLALFPLLMACKKNKEEPPKTQFTYTVNNFGDLTIEEGTPKIVNYEVKLLSGNQQSISLSTNGLPKGISVDFAPATGFATYNTVATYRADGSIVATGEYPFTLIAKTENQADKILNAKIKVINNCSNLFESIYNVTENCSTGSDYYTSSITKVAGYSSRCLISNLYNDGVNVYGDFNCDDKTIVIPMQTFSVPGGTYSVNGTGSFNTASKTLEITYTISDGIFTNTCTAQYFK